MERVCYGHIHNSGRDQVLQGVVNGVDYKLVSADYLNFDPLLIAQLPKTLHE